MSARIRPVTASAAHRVRRGSEGCDYPRRYDIPPPPLEKPDADREAGIKAHAEIAHGLLSGELVTKRQGEVFDYVMGLKTNDADTILVERAFAWSPAWCEDIGMGRESYAKAPWGRVFGTADLVMLYRGADGRAIKAGVYDWKTGPMLDGAAEAGPQLRVLAALVLEAMHEDASIDLEKAEMWAIHVREDGTLYQFFHGAMDRSEAAGVLASYAAESSDNDPHPGPWCKHCPYEGACPAHLRAAELVVPPEALVPRGRFPWAVASDEDAVTALGLRKWAEKASDVLYEQGKAWIAKQGGSIVVDGREYRSVQVTEHRTSLADALALARSKGATEEEVTALAKEGGYTKIASRKADAPRGKKLPKGDRS